MFSKIRIFSPKNSSKKPMLNKSLPNMTNNVHISTNANKKNQINQQILKSNSVDNSLKRFLRDKKERHLPNLYNLILHKHNSQGSLYIHKNNLNNSLNYIYQNLNSNLFCEARTPKLLDIINYQIRKKKNYVDTYSNFLEDKNIIRLNSNLNSSMSSVHKRKNISQSNKSFTNLDECCFQNIFKGSRNIKKAKPKDNSNNENIQINKTKYNRYDKTKCIIERKIYGGNNKGTKYNKEKIVGNKTFKKNYEKIYRKSLYNQTKSDINLNLRKEIDNRLNNLKIEIEEQNNNINSKYLLKSKTNNILNTFFDDYNNDNKGEKMNKNLDIKLIYPSFMNKLDSYNDSSQESTNQIGTSNKLTINNHNNIKKEKFISGFLDGPEDIHFRFVDLHKQRKMFYENYDGVIKDDENIMGKQNGNINDNKSNSNLYEFSEYFENFDEVVPII